MRGLIVPLLLLAAACAPAQQRAGCDVSITREEAFSGVTEHETVTARLYGQSCDRTIALYTIHDAESRPLWSWTAPTARAFGDEFTTADEEHLQAFVVRWADPHVTTTAEAPPWGALEPGQTTLDELTFEDLRGRELPMLCHLSGVARESCVFWEPAAGAAGLLYERLATTAEEAAGPS